MIKKIFPNLIIVGASGHENRNRLAKFSNYSSLKVDCIAPGVSIRVPATKIDDGEDSTFSNMVSGTSFSAPIVTNIIAKIIKSFDSKKSPKEIKKIFIKKYLKKDDKLSSFVKQGYYLPLENF